MLRICQNLLSAKENGGFEKYIFIMIDIISAVKDV